MKTSYFKVKAFALLLCLPFSSFGVQAAVAAASITLSKSSGPPTTPLTVKGSGFTAGVLVDIFFDVTDRCLVVVDSAGKFTCTFKVTNREEPGSHWVTAITRWGSVAAQKLFQVNTNWPDEGGGLRNLGYNPYENMISVASAEEVRERWRVSASYIYSSPVIVNGSVYFGAYDGQLRAVDANTGVAKAHFPYGTGDYIFTSPAVAGAMVYVGTSHGRLHAVNSTTGTASWIYSVDSGIHSPAVAGGVVYFGTEDGSLYALDASTGMAKWTLPYATGSKILGSPAIVNGLIYVGALDGKLHVIDDKANVAWTFDTGSAIHGSPTVADGIVYIGTVDGKLHAINARTGVSKWVSNLGSPIYSSPAVGKGGVFVGTYDGKLHMVRTTTGIAKWSPVETGSYYASSPSVVDFIAFFGTQDGRIHMINTASGTKIGEFHTGGAVRHVPVVNGMVYAGSEDKGLYAYSLPDGGEVQATNKRKAPAPGLLKPDYTLDVTDE